MFDVKQIKKDFPIFKKNPRIVYLDSTATSLKPQSVIDAMNDYYTDYSSNIHRGLYPIAEKASLEYEEAREVVAQFVGAKSKEEIIFTRNATESLNLLAYTLESEIKPTDEILTSIVEHHANFVTWQQLAKKTGATFSIIDIDDHADLDIIDSKGVINVKKYVTKKTKIFSLHYISNVLGGIQPIKKIIAAVRKINPKTLIIIDAAQAAPHHTINVQDLDCDFLVLSAHKMCGPTGIGVLWGRKSLLDNLRPFMFGGDMIDEVFTDNTTFNKVPHKFEAGTPDISGVIGTKAAVKYLEKVGLKHIQNHESVLATYAIKSLHQAFGDDIYILGEESRRERIGVVSFTLKRCHPHDIAGMLGEDNICIRAGHHCAMPLHTRFSLNASCRASFYLYSEKSDVDQFVTGLQKIHKMFT